MEIVVCVTAVACALVGGCGGVGVVTNTSLLVADVPTLFVAQIL